MASASCSSALTWLPVVPAEKKKFPATPADSFSGREVFMLEDNMIIVNVRVPLPEGVCVQLDGGRVLPVQFLPPIEVRLLLSPDRLPFEAHISCVWLKFKQVRIVAGCLDAWWKPKDPLEVMLEFLLEEFPVKALAELKLNLPDEHLDLGWWSRSAHESTLLVEQPKSPRRKHKNIVVKTFTRFRKGDNISEIIQKYNDEEMAYRSIPGSSLVDCAVAATCAMTILPTRVFRCPEGHIVCTCCLTHQLMASKCFPLCPSYQCEYEFTYQELIRLAAGNTEVLNHIYSIESTRSLVDSVGKNCMHECKRCSAKTFPEFYIQRNSITICRVCGECSCKTCSTYTPYDFKCDAMRFKKEILDGPPDQLAERCEGYSNEYLQRIKDAFYSQYHKIWDIQLCPWCFTAIHKTEGCNKMMCGNCSQPFCYVCCEKLDRIDPYRHFDRDGNCTRQ